MEGDFELAVHYYSLHLAFIGLLHSQAQLHRRFCKFTGSFITVFKLYITRLKSKSILF